MTLENKNNNHQEEKINYTEVIIDLADTAIDEGSKHVRQFMEDTKETREEIAKGVIRVSKLGLSAALSFVERLDKKYNK